MRHTSAHKLVAIMTVLLTALGFLLILYADAWGPAKFLVGVLLMVSCGISLKNLLGIEGEWGMLLIRTRKGLGMMELLAKTAPGLWKFLADLGIVMGFGLLSVFIFREIPKWRLVIGMLLLLLFSQLILPMAGPLALETINLPTGSASLGSQAAQQAMVGSGADALLLFIQLLYYLVFLSTMAGGLVLAGLAGLALKAFTVLVTLAVFIVSLANGVPNGQALAGEAPGATFVLPGINLPLIEGVLALAVLLVVHESAHGVLARTLKIRLKSAGIVLFGIIPAGAFVDPDEKQLQSVEPEKQNRVLVAGSTSNLATAVVFFILFALLQSAILSAYPTDKIGTSYVKVVGIVENSSAQGFIQPGEILASWKGQDAATIQDFKDAANGTVEGQLVPIATDKGTVWLRAGKDGKVGVQVAQETYSLGDWVRELAAAGNPIPVFLFNFVAITFVLNILVGIINLFPIPPFDGYRIVALACGKKKVLWMKLIDLIIYAIVICFILNLLPWAWS